MASNDLSNTIRQIVPDLLQEHAYGIYDLAQTCAQQVHAPVCEVLTPLAEALCELASGGRVHYDRQANQVAWG